MTAPHPAVRPTLIRPVDMPRLRDEMVRTAESGMWQEMLRRHRESGLQVRLPVHRLDDGRMRSWTTNEYIAALVRWLRVADLYHVTAELTAVARQGAATFPPYRLSPSDPPAKVGLVVWDEPIYVADVDSTYVVEPGSRSFAPPEPVPEGTTIAIRAALWAPCDPGGLNARTGVMVVLFADTDVLLAGPRYTSEPDYETGLPFMRRSLGPLYYHDEAPLPFVTATGDADDWWSRPVRNTAIGGVITTWLLMAQRITVAEPAAMPRALRRQYARAGREEPTVRVVTLRRAQVPHREDGEQVPTRQYHHQWIVQGFWREQWYPSLNRHKTIYIAQHIRGPEGAPMIGGERIYNLAR